MAGNFHEDFQRDDMPDLPSDRSTGLVLAGAAAVAAILFRHTPVLLWGASATAVLLSSLALTVPSILAPLNRAWFRLGLLLNRVVSPVVMLVLFAVVIVPYGLAMQLVSDPLRRRLKAANPATYWKLRSTEEAPPPDLRRQF